MTDIGIAEVPYRSEFPLVGYAQTIAVFVEETAAVVTLAILHDFLDEVVLSRFVHVHQLFDMVRSRFVQSTIEREHLFLQIAALRVCEHFRLFE